MGKFFSFDKEYTDIKKKDYLCIKLDKKKEIKWKYMVGIILFIIILAFIIYFYNNYISFDLYIRYERSKDELFENIEYEGKGIFLLYNNQDNIDSDNFNKLNIINTSSVDDYIISIKLKDNSIIVEDFINDDEYEEYEYNITFDKYKNFIIGHVDYDNEELIITMNNNIIYSSKYGALTKISVYAEYDSLLDEEYNSFNLATSYSNEWPYDSELSNENIYRVKEKLYNTETDES